MIERRPFGRTGHESSRVIFGAAALGPINQDEADELLPILLEYGVNHIDVAPSYGKGNAESCLKPWMASHREDFFLATKTKGRMADDTRVSLEESLVRLGVDHVDLIQLHNLVEEEDWQLAHGKGGAIEGLLRARDEGLCRFIGVTGHGTRIARMHLRSIERFDFDSVIVPCNYPLFSFGDYRGEAEELIARCSDRNIAVQAIKFAAVGRWEQLEHPPELSTRRAWYETLEPGPALVRAADFVLGRPEVFLISSMDRSLLRPTLDAARAPGSIPNAAEMEADLAALHLRAMFDGDQLERA